MNPLFSNSALYNIPKTDNHTLLLSGNNLKNILVAIPSKDFNEKTKLLLKNILTAINCDFENDITLIQLGELDQICIKQFIDQYQAKTLLSFGLTTHQLSLNIEKNVNHHFYISSTRILLSPGLIILDQNRDQKLFLWNQLKKMFDQ